MLPVAKASLTAGADMLKLEVHPNLPVALSDAKQQLSLEEFSTFYEGGNFDAHIRVGKGKQKL